MPDALELWTHGTVDSEITQWFQHLSNMSTIELSQLIPFIRITPIIVVGTNIVEEKDSIDFSTQQIYTENLKGKYALKGMNLRTAGEPAGVMFTIDMDIDVFDLSLLEHSDRNLDNISYLLSLNNYIKIEFGWGSQFKWNRQPSTNINNANNHYGRGAELFGAVGFTDVSISENAIITIKIKISAVGNIVLNDFSLDSLFNIIIDDIPSTETFETRKGWFGRIFSKHDYRAKKGISLSSLFTYIKNQMEEAGLNKIGVVIPDINTNMKLKNIEPFRNSINATTGLKPNTNNPTVGDIVISDDAIKDIYSKSNNLRNFIKNICKLINEESVGTLTLQAIALPPSGAKIQITNQAQVDKGLSKSQGDMSASERRNEQNKKRENQKAEILSYAKSGKYLNLKFYTGNTIVKNISFQSDISDAGKNSQLFVDMGQIANTTPIELRRFIDKWYIPEGYAEIGPPTEQQQAEIQQQRENLYNQSYKNILSEISKISIGIKSPGDINKLIDDFHKTIKSIEIQDQSLKYLPYKFDATIIGLTGIWNGTRIYLDNDCPIPFLKNTVWRITELSHELTPESWTTTFSAAMEYSKYIEENN